MNSLGMQWLCATLSIWEATVMVVRPLPLRRVNTQR